jgi:aerobic carbon-monoxide dehydrogenase medium subunit
MLNMRLLEPPLLVDINRLPELRGIVTEGPLLRVGSLVRHAELATSPVVTRHAPLLSAAVRSIAHPAIRNRGTFGGSLAHADPAAELPACAVALDAELHVAGPKGRRMVKARDFFTGALATALTPGEILIETRIPAQKGGTLFLEFARRHGDYALAGLAGWAARDRGGRIVESRLVFFGVGAKPVEAPLAARALAGSVDAAASALAQELKPVADLNASAVMKTHLAQVLLRRAVAAFGDRAA